MFPQTAFYSSRLRNVSFSTDLFIFSKCPNQVCCNKETWHPVEKFVRLICLHLLCPQIGIIYIKHRRDSSLALSYCFSCFALQVCSCAPHNMMATRKSTSSEKKSFVVCIMLLTEQLTASEEQPQA